MSILPTLNSTGCLRADLNVNLARHATSSLLIKIRNLSGKHARWMSLFALRLFYIFFLWTSDFRTHKVVTTYHV